MKNFKSVNIDAVNESSKDWLENDQQANVFTANNALLVNKINEKYDWGVLLKHSINLSSKYYSNDFTG